MRPFLQLPSLALPRVNRDLALLLVVVVGSNLPFISQPFHMDDNFYLDMARNAASRPLFPNDTPYIFEGKFLADMGSHSHPPLQTYFLALLQALFGDQPGAERQYHSSALLFPVLAVVAFYFLSARFVERPLWPSLLLAVAPVFQVMSHSLMTDIPSLAFWLAAIASFVWAVDLRRAALFGLSAVFQFAAMFTSYQSVALTPLLGFYLWKKRGGRAALAALAAPLLGLALWLCLSSLHYGRFVLGDTVGYVRSREALALVNLAIKLAALLQYQGWLVILPVFLLYLLARGLRWRLLLLCAVGSAYLCQVLVPDYRLIDKLVFALGATAGTAAVLSMARLLQSSFLRSGEDCGFDPADGRFLGLWYFGVLTYCLLLFTEGSARYTLPMVPPFLLVFFRRLEMSETAEYRRARRPWLRAAMVASGSFVLTTAWGLLLSQADWEWARIYPSAARDAARVAGALPRYFHGEWGFRYYQRAAGAMQLPLDETEVSGGSILVNPELALPYDLPAGLQSMTLPYHSFSYGIRTMLRTLDSGTPAGFYSTGWGLVPFSLSGRSAETVTLRQVSCLVERLPSARVQSDTGVWPWPGYAEIDGAESLALLARAGTEVSYPWSPPAPAVLEAVCVVHPGRSTSPEGERYRFGLRQRDGEGRVLSRADLEIVRPEQAAGGAGNTLRLGLRAEGAQGGTLELTFESPDDPGAVGAFARAILRPGAP